MSLDNNVRVVRAQQETIMRLLARTITQMIVLRGVSKEPSSASSVESIVSRCHNTTASEEARGMVYRGRGNGRNIAASSLLTCLRLMVGDDEWVTGGHLQNVFHLNIGQNPILDIVEV